MTALVQRAGTARYSLPRSEFYELLNSDVRLMISPALATPRWLISPRGTTGLRFYFC